VVAKTHLSTVRPARFINGGEKITPGDTIDRASSTYGTRAHVRETVMRIHPTGQVLQPRHF
jgi:hypothetical protein